MKARVLVTLLATMAAAVVSADEVGAVKVRVVLESRAVKGLLPNIPDAERAAAIEIVRRIAESAEMSFVRWLPEQSAARAEARLIVTLYDQKPVPDLPSEHYVKYHAEILAPEGRNVRPLVSEYGRGRKVFATTDERKKLGKKDELVQALAQIVIDQLTARRPHFMATFLYHVPLSRTKPILEDEGTVVVPLRWDSLGASDESVLEIRIAARPPAQRQGQEGKIVLSGLFKCGSCETPSIRGKAKEFVCHGIGNVPPDPWDRVVGPTREGMTSHVVYMKIFVPSYTGVFEEFGDGR